MSPISSGFPELAPNPEHVEFFSQISSVFLKALEKPVFLLPWWLNKKNTKKARKIKGKVNLDTKQVLGYNTFQGLESKLTRRGRPR